MNWVSRAAGAALVAVAMTASATPEPGVVLYHVGVQNLPNFLTGTYAGQANPNHNRLTFLLSHTFADTPTNNHFHRIGAYGLSGPASSPSVGFITNNATPEPYQLDNGLSLLAGSGVFAGKLISGLGPAQLLDDHIEAEYGDLTIMPIDELFPSDGLNHPTLAGLKHPEHYLLNASAGAYKGSVAAVTVGMTLSSISSGLSVLDQAGAPLWGGVGQTLTLGTGAVWSFEPVFAVDASVPAGTPFSATFTLRDLSASPSFGDSAPFTFNFVTVPEPTTAGLLLVGACGFAVCRRRG
ncbi:MAG: all3515 family Zur-repressed PEP-CTERM protein [Lacipirellulaceae bacterium]